MQRCGGARRVRACWPCAALVPTLTVYHTSVTTSYAVVTQGKGERIAFPGSPFPMHVTAGLPTAEES